MRAITPLLLFLALAAWARPWQEVRAQVHLGGVPEKVPDLPVKEAKKLATLMNKRLSLMKDVAAYKWEHQLPIEDLEREKVVLESSIKQATALGLDSASIYTYFQIQIDLAKKVQQHWFATWQKAGYQPYTYADLTTEVRPALLELGNNQLQAILQLEPWKYQDQRSRSLLRRIFEKELMVSGITKLDEFRLYESVWQVRPTT
ncbi:MAG: gamma subclass chorismate mutase AroQ [Bacteroidetes bacterium]|nr:MAG: gamma subclass chorismate mutase AroQ [Bacteroidota bacterium]